MEYHEATSEDFVPPWRQAQLMDHFTADELLTRIPDQALIDNEVGKPERLKSNYIAATRAAGGTKAMVHCADGRAVRVRLDRLAGGDIFAFWYNPRRGTWHGEVGEHSRPTWFVRDVTSGPGASAREFTPPTQGAGEDWVLVLSRKDLGGAN